jgi:hypothetical protein
LLKNRSEARANEKIPDITRGFFFNSASRILKMIVQADWRHIEAGAGGRMSIPWKAERLSIRSVEVALDQPVLDSHRAADGLQPPQ